MSRTRATAGAPIWIILAVVFPAMIASAGALSFYGYRYAHDVSLRMEDAFRENAEIDARRLVANVEARIDAEARALLEAIDLPVDGPESDACDVPPSAFADSYAVTRFSAQGALRVVCVGGAELPMWRPSRSSTAPGAYLKALDFSSVQAGNFRYLHQRFEREEALIAYMGKQSDDGRSYFVALRVRLGRVLELVRERIEELASRRQVVVLDRRRRPVLGSPPEGSATAEGPRFLYQAAFGRVLYAWDLQIYPRDIQALREQERKQRVLGPALVILSSAILAVGLVIVWLGVLAERRASRLRSDFIANVSHELKTPLSLIRMFGELLATGRHRGETQVAEYGAIVTRESERLTHLIDNVLDFSRLERGQASYRFAQGRPEEVLERAVDLCRHRVERERRELRVQVDPDLPEVRLDEDAFTLAFLNLIDNALKYGGEGPIEVALARGPAHVVVRVRDHGPGVPREERERIFERFYRARGARESGVRGTGIGLALVKSIAEAHGGRATAEPVPGEAGSGIVFCIYLPASVPRAPGAAGSAGEGGAGRLAESAR